MTPLNQELKALYQRHWDQLEDALRSHNPVELGLSNPLLIDLPYDWKNIHPKLMIVGQQTCGWGFFGSGNELDLIGGLMADYTNFCLGQFYRPTPFWQASYVVHMSINSASRPFGFAWTNLVKLDQKSRRPAPQIEELVSHNFPVAADELAIVRPDIIVFFTGPNYDKRLRQIFDGACLENVAADTIGLARVKHKALPDRSFRSYHPGYLARFPIKYERTMRKLVECINT